MTIFKDVIFYLDGFAPDIDEELIKYGGTRATLPDDNSRVTHIITTDFNRKTTRLMEKKGIPIVNVKWVEASIRRKHLQNIKYFSADPRYFFTGVVIICIELSNGDLNAIHEGVLALGGQCTEVLSKNVTHIIALDINNQTCRQVLKRPELGIKILSPEWFNNCLKQRQRVDETPYLLTNYIFDENRTKTDPVLSPMIEKINDSVEKLNETPLKFTKQVLKNKKIFFSKDLEINENLLHTIETIVLGLGAILVSSIQNATVFIGMYREGNEYIQAVHRGIIIGNLTWLYWMYVYETWANPELNLLHYPIVKAGLPEMHKMVITISNYQGESRQYLEKLIKALGATFTKNMTPSNTHLIIPCEFGEKYSAALEWNIHIVNHLWLEETYAEWKLQNITTPRYIYFPPKTSFMKIVGNTPIDLDVIKLIYKDVSNVLVEEKSPLKESNLLKHSNNISLNNNELPLDSFSSSLDMTSTLDNFGLQVHSDNESSFQVSNCDSTKENPPPFHKRRAATVALERLHNEIMPDVLLYQKECKRKTFIDSSEDIINSKKKLKEISIEFKDLKNNQVSVKRKTIAKPFPTNKDFRDYNIRILVTGYKDWDNQMEKALLTIGIATVQDAKDCTHLVASRIQRTQKFLSALSYVPKILSVDWIETCLKEGKIVDENNYFLIDPESELKYNFKLLDSLDRARNNKHSLFKGYLLQISPAAVSNYSNGIDTIKEIIEVNGGVCTLAISRKNQIEYELIPILISNISDVRILKHFIEKRKEAGEVPLVYNMEWVLTTVLRQELNFTDENSLLEEYNHLYMS
ncbi:hypothetical protein T552_02447 [Pneumocystis carinii B80]|uniref:BRCT domain-containing protein n=1 Tax=Pneumocystis carinii (strain B80) TaxID=1408658 RepID=A0A0W4ZF10_PNEC8|nr:hypothetical protein T552_02447 [Pneumocystis carinii B80]KTW26957.1 hypothetical protein T552_02447 [Pneumocystis carinii B80]